MKYLRHIYVQVVVGVFLGALFGYFFPNVGTNLKPVGDVFIKLVKMLIGPIIFATIVLGIGNIHDLKKVGRVGLKALIYFEIVTTAALAIGLTVANLVRPGDGIHAKILSQGIGEAAGDAIAAKKLSVAGFLQNIVPETFVGAFSSGEILQVLLVAVLSGLAAAQLGEKARPLLSLVEQALKILMRIVGLLMKLAPLAAFGALAFAVGQFGIGSLVSLAKLMFAVYLTMAAFVVIVLGGILRLNGLSLWGYLRHIREEIFLVLGTSSSETALPGMIARMEELGCSKSVVGLVLPAGYSFNLDGTCIYLTMAAVFIAQATDTPLTVWQQLGMLAILLLTSKGAAAVTGGGFVTLSATLATTHTVPVSGLTLLLGVDRFMSEARAITNLIGNGVAVIVTAIWEKEFDHVRARQILHDQKSRSSPADSPAMWSRNDAKRAQTDMILHVDIDT